MSGNFFAVLWFFGLAFLCPTLVWAGSIFSPARLLEGEGSIESLLHVPQDLPRGLYVVRCEVLVSVRGQARAVGCYSEKEPPGQLLSRVEHAASEARYGSAIRDGQPIEAYMQLMVRVYVAGDGSLVLAVPNNGADVDRYGLLYTAPQRLTKITWPMWYEHYRLLLWPKLSIDEQGKVTAFTITDASGTPVHLVHHFESQMKALEFIPGFFDRKPRPMLYVKALYTNPPP